MQIEKKIIKYNKTAAKGRKIKYIVIHDTGNKGKGAGVDSHFNFFNGGDRQSSADFFVDDAGTHKAVSSSDFASCAADYADAFMAERAKRWGNE